MSDIHDNDEVLFDRLIDGELSADERRRLIASLDDRTDGWRRCALAFLEAQTWRGAMQRIVAEPVATVTPRATSAGNRESLHAASCSWLGIAAGLLLAFGLGWQWNRPSEPQGVELAIDSTPPAPQAADLAPLSSDDAITLVVQNHEGQPQRLQLPLVEGRRLGEQFADAPQWAIPAVREQFVQQGFDLQARRRYLPLFFEQQDRVVPMIVPVDDAVVTPVSKPIY